MSIVDKQKTNKKLFSHLKANRRLRGSVLLISLLNHHRTLKLPTAPSASGTVAPNTYAGVSDTVTIQTLQTHLSMTQYIGSSNGCHFLSTLTRRVRKHHIRPTVPQGCLRAGLRAASGLASVLVASRLTLVPLCE